MNTAPATNLTEQRVRELGEQYTREELTWMTRERKIEWSPIQVGTGPFDHAPEQTPECVFCDEHLVDYDDHGTITALGLGVYARSRWIVAHTRCVRAVEDQVVFYDRSARAFAPKPAACFGCSHAPHDGTCEATTYFTKQRCACPGGAACEPTR